VFCSCDDDDESMTSSLECQPRAIVNLPGNYLLYVDNVHVDGQSQHQVFNVLMNEG